MASRLNLHMSSSVYHLEFFPPSPSSPATPPMPPNPSASENNRTLTLESNETRRPFDASVRVGPMPWMAPSSSSSDEHMLVVEARDGRSDEIEEMGIMILRLGFGGVAAVVVVVAVVLDEVLEHADRVEDDLTIWDEGTSIVGTFVALGDGSSTTCLRMGNGRAGTGGDGWAWRSACCILR